MKITCKVIESLLPLYADYLVSEDSIALVEEHLDNCNDCQTYLKDLKDSNPIYDIDDITSQKLASSNTLVKIKKNYHWFLMNIGVVMFLMSTIVYFFISDLLNKIMSLSSLGEILSFIILSCTLAFNVILMFVRFFCKNKTIKQKDTINKITIVSLNLLLNFSLIFSLIGRQQYLIYLIGCAVAFGLSMIYIALKLYDFYNLSFTLTSDYYIKNAVWFTIVTALIMMFDKFRMYVFWSGFNGNIYWFYSSVITIVIALVFLIFAIKLHNFDLEKPRQIITKEYKILQSIVIALGVYLQGANLFVYNLKFVDYENIGVYIKPLQTLTGIADYTMIFLTILFTYCLYSILKNKQYIMVWLMMQCFVLSYEKVAYLDIILGNMDDPAYIPLDIYWVFLLMLILTTVYVFKMRRCCSDK